MEPPVLPLDYNDSFVIHLHRNDAKSMRIYGLIVEPGREEHISQHQVTVAEVEEVVFGHPFVRKTRQGRFHLIGQTDAGRYLTVFLAPRGNRVYGLVTARDADASERRAYRQHRRQ